MTTKTQKKRKSATDSQRKRDESATNPRRIRYAFAPILQQFRAHTRKNEARLWIPIETSLLIRYEFAALSPQTRYAFVAILLYCGANGTDEIPLDARFMSNVLVIDVRTLQKSFDELLFANLLQERIERIERKEQTDRQEDASRRVCVDDFNSLKTEEENQSSLLNEEGLIKSNGNSKHSQFTIEECLRYVEACQAKGEQVQSPKALANKLHKTGEADSFIKATLYPEQFASETFGAPVRFSDEPCSVCFGAKMSDADGKGYRACEHCRNERGKSTGFEPEGENSETIY